MSALPLKADMCGAARDVCFGPIADIAALFDQLVGAQLACLERWCWMPWPSWDWWRDSNLVACTTGNSAGYRQVEAIHWPFNPSKRSGQSSRSAGRATCL